MGKLRRTFLIVLLVGLLAILAFIFRSFILSNFIKPIAILLWLFWRFFLSIDQVFIWTILVIAALAYAFWRLINMPIPIDTDTAYTPNDTLENVNYWRNSILLTSDETEKDNVLKRDLANMLAALYASKQPGKPVIQFYTALKRRQILIPDHIYNLLFEDDTPETQPGLVKTLRAIWHNPRKWIRRWTGRDVQEYHRAIEDVISFMETTMEIEQK